MTDEEIIREALRKIEEGHYNSACGQLRILLEKYLTELCANNRNVHPRNGDIFNMIQALYDARIVNQVDKSKLLTWNTFGNAGCHANTPPVRKEDAKYFLEGISGLLGIQITTPEVVPVETQISNNTVQRLKKNDALKILNEKTNHLLKNGNCIYSNINNSKPVWWF